MVSESIISVGRALLVKPDGHGGHLSGGNPSPSYLYKEGLGRPMKDTNRKQWRSFLIPLPCLYH